MIHRQATKQGQRQRQRRAWGLGLGLLISLVLVAAGWSAWRAMAERTAQQARAERLVCALPQQPASAPQPGMVWVPAGSFELGDTVYPEELPLRRTRVEGFWMDRTEVTNAEFAAFVQATAYQTVAERPVDRVKHPDLPPPLQQAGAVVFVMPNEVQGRGDIAQWWRYIAGANWRHPGGPDTSIEGRAAYPVVAVTLQDAQAYARWKGRALPSEAQWEWAARAARPEPSPTHEPPGAANTWQGIFPVLNSGDDGFVGLAPVGCYAPNALGLHDMIGNVWELTADAWTAHHANDQADAAEPPAEQPPVDARRAAPAQQVIKGGSFLCAPNYCMRYRAGARQPQDADLAASHLGFRTVLSAAGP